MISTRRLAYAAVAATYLLIVMGAIVRASGSGLGCPDWPLCYGQPLPPAHPPAMIEYSHRFMGAITALLVVGTAIRVWRVAGRTERGWTAVAAVIPVLLLIQILLGAVTVALELPPMVVLAHLGLAMLLLGLLVTIAVAVTPYASVGDPRLAPSQRFRRLATAGVAAVYLLVLTGAYVRASGASWACLGFPTCNGELLPFGANRLVDVQLLHRLVALAVGAHLLVVAARAWRTERQVPGLSGGAAVLVACLLAQVSIGAYAVSHPIQPVAQVLHVAGAAALWAATVALAARAWGIRLAEGSVAVTSGAGAAPEAMSGPWVLR